MIRIRSAALVTICLVLASCGDDAGVTSRRSTGASSSEATTSVPATLPPAGPTSTEPVEPATTGPATTGPTTTVERPVGAVDLGHGAYISLPAGWQQRVDSDEVVTITDGEATVGIQVLAREPGEDPADALQELVDTFDTDYSAVAYAPVRVFEQFDTSPPLVEYSSAYRTFDAENRETGTLLSGVLTLFVRGDGLTALVDLWSETASGLPEAAWQSLVDSLVAAPTLGDVGPLVPREPFRLSSVHQFVAVDGLTGFTLAPGFSVVDHDGGGAWVSNGTRDFEAYLLRGVAGLDAALAEAEAIVAASYHDVVYEPIEDFGPDAYGVVRRGAGWSGVYTADGSSCGGIVEAIYDPTTTNAVILVDGWYWPDGGGQPDKAEAMFMYNALLDSFTSIG